MQAWLDMHDAFRRSGAWPDGGAYLRQSNITVRVFQIVESQLIKEARRDGKRS